MEFTAGETIALQRAEEEARIAAKKRQRAANKVKKIEDQRRAKALQAERDARFQREEEELEQKKLDFKHRWETDLQCRMANLNEKVAKAAADLAHLETERRDFTLSFRNQCVHEYHLPPGAGPLFYCSSNKVCMYCQKRYPCDCRSCEGAHN